MVPEDVTIDDSITEWRKLESYGGIILWEMARICAKVDGRWGDGGLKVLAKEVGVSLSRAQQLRAVFLVFPDEASRIPAGSMVDENSTPPYICFSIYQACAEEARRHGYDRKVAQKWLERAYKNHWAHRELKAAILPRRELPIEALEPLQRDYYQWFSEHVDGDPVKFRGFVAAMVAYVQTYGLKDMFAQCLAESEQSDWRFRNALSSELSKKRRKRRVLSEPDGGATEGLAELHEVQPLSEPNDGCAWEGEPAGEDNAGGAEPGVAGRQDGDSVCGSGGETAS